MEQVLSEIIFSIFRRYFPVTYHSDIKDEELNQYKKLFGWYDFVFFVVFLLILTTTTFLVYLTGAELATNLHSYSSSKWLLTYYAPKEFWILPGLILSFSFVAIFMMLLGKHLLFKKKWILYEEFTNRKYGFDGIRVSWFFVRLFSPIVVIISILGLDWYIKIDNNDMEVKNFFSPFTNHYSFRNIKTITSFKRTIAPNGNIVSNPHFVLDFTDGSTWSSFNSLIEDEDTTAVSFFSKITHKKVIPQDINYTP